MTTTPDQISDQTPSQAPTDTAEPQLDMEALEAFVGKVAVDLSGAMATWSVDIGDRLGFYKVLAEGPHTAEQLAGRTGTHPRLVTEWLAGQTVAEYVVREAGPDGDTFRLSPEQAMVLANDVSPAFLVGNANIVSSIFADRAGMDALYRGETTRPWGEGGPLLHTGTDRTFTPGYAANLVPVWLPALEGVVEKLERGARVADVGSGYGTPTRMLAEAFPNVWIDAIDNHPESVEIARSRAEQAGLGEDRIRWQLGGATELASGPYDLICFFDSLHDMGDPGQVIAHVRTQLADGGTVMMVEPMAAESLDEATGQLFAKMYFVGSSAICTPGALSQGGTALGNQVPDSVWRDLFTSNGFSVFRRAAEAPFNRVFEARP